MKVAIPPMGQYTAEIIKQLGDYLGWDIISSPIPSDATIELGAKYMDELMCLPAKMTLGSFIQACDKGATELLMFDSCGLCRLKTYWILQERALRKLGYDVTVHPVRLGKMTPRDICSVDPSIPYWKALVAFIKILHQVNELDNKLWVEILDESNLVKIGIVGEIYTILEPAANRNLVRKLEKLGALVHNSLPLSYFIFKGFYNRGWMKRRGIDRKTFMAAKKQAYEYFPKEIGGHGVESIIHTIYYGMKRFDGVIHILPFPCMPESTVSPILHDISRDYNIPVMKLIFDTHTGEGGLNTRLEAFVDMLQRKKAS
ncbi:unnamed protein product [marine sediment metagenome]|uniref:DUF2229 domain-containing protein n=1 Tax=marine sediment metagenome TaxID=412755 RepID=X1R9M6_9ZZZZ